jgi:hypothetical protein
MTPRTRTAKATSPAPATPAKKTAAKRAPAKKAARVPRKRNTEKPPTQPSLSLVKATPPRTDDDGRRRDFVTDAQIYAVHAARLAGLPIHRIRDWCDHGDGTATRPLKDGTLHYTHATRTLTWQATCLMGAIHTYRLDSPSTAAAARVQAATCQQLHADLTTIPKLTPNELEGLGLLQTPTWARPDLLGDAITETIPVPDEPVTRATASAADTQPISRADIAAGLAARTADIETAKEHPQP